MEQRSPVQHARVWMKIKGMSSDPNYHKSLQINQSNDQININNFFPQNQHSFWVNMYASSIINQHDNSFNMIIQLECARECTSEAWYLLPGDIIKREFKLELVNIYSRTYFCSKILLTYLVGLTLARKLKRMSYIPTRLYKLLYTIPILWCVISLT